MVVRERSPLNLLNTFDTWQSTLLAILYRSLCEEVSRPATLHGLKTQEQDRDRDSEGARPKPRLRGARPRSKPRLVKTGLEKSRDQDSSLENSNSAFIDHEGNKIT